LSAAEVIALLGLQKHPEGGHFRETYRHRPAEGQRGACTAIYYLLAAGEQSAWHRVDATEIWHWYGGAPLRLSIAAEDHERATHILGDDLANGQRPQAVVPAFAWQAAVSLGRWTLVGCTVAPAFSFDGFELAPRNWQPRG
jgi:predicted cupin superfamily sugar epimerase